MGAGLRRINFAFDIAKIEPAVVAHKAGDGFELTFNKGFVVARDCDSENGDFLAVVVVDFGNGYVEPALQPANYGFYDAALLFERADTLQMHIGCHRPDYHKFGYFFRPSEAALRLTPEGDLPSRLATCQVAVVL